jgi:hypothetical protein
LRQRTDSKSLRSKLERDFQIAENWSQGLYIKRSSSAKTPTLSR